MREDWKEYIAFSRKERRGVIVLLILLFAVIVAPRFFPGPARVENQLEQRDWRERLAKWKQIEKEKPEYVTKKGGRRIGEQGGRFQEDQIEGELKRDYSNASVNGEALPATDSRPFPFDPNTLQASGWQRLGIPDKVIRTIVNYLSKGGQFRKPADLGKIYGMRPVDAKRLLPYVKIELPQRIATGHSAWPARIVHGRYLPDTTKAAFTNASPTFQPVRKKRYSNLDINTADTTAWSGFPGIGSKLAARIVNYRDKLGGFYSPEQVGETWALPDSTFQKIKPWLQCTPTSLRKIRINEATVEELKQHPYLRWNLANAILQYRQQHGAFRSATDLQGIILMTPLLITKIAPYIEY